MHRSRRLSEHFPPPAALPTPRLARDLGLLGLTATGICSMIGAAINIVPFMIQRSIPGIGAWVLPTYALAALPAILAGLAYAILSSAMPRAGGSYVFASRAVSPYLGFAASFSQWFGLCTAIGVVSYVLSPFLRDIAVALQWDGTAAALERGGVRLTVALAFLWAFVLVNLRGVKSVERTLVPLMILMFVIGAIVIVAGFSHDHADFAAALLEREGRGVPSGSSGAFDLRLVLAAAPVLFSSFIGFDSIAQVGGEARDPGRTLPLTIGIAVAVVGGFYMLFTAAVYHAVPWQYVAEQARLRDVTAPGLLTLLLPPWLTVVIVSGAAVALINDLPAMILAVSRLMFAWGEDGIFPRAVTRVHPRWRTPHVAIVASGMMATAAILGSHFAGDFFLGVDVLVTSMLVNFLLMCVSVILLPVRNPAIARDVTVLPSRALQLPVATLGIVLLGTLLVAQVWKDLTAPAAAWYFRSTPIWLLVMAVATLIYLRETAKLRAGGVDLASRFATLPPE